MSCLPQAVSRVSKFRVKSRQILSDTKMGPIRVQWIAQNNALSLFSVRERAAILQDCARRMGEHWIMKWLPARFSGYARRSLGYRSRPKYDKSKRKQFGSADPLTYTGALQSAAIEGATAKGQSGGPKGSPSVIVRIPLGHHPLAEIVQQVIKTVPRSEIDDLAEVFGAHLKQLINGANTNDTRSRLRPAQRGLLGLSTTRTIGRRGLARLARTVRVESIVSRLGKGR